MNEITLAAKRGADLLDVISPGWADELDMDTFNMSSAFHCAAAQTMGKPDDADEDNRAGYDLALRRMLGDVMTDTLSASLMFARAFGFSAPYGEFDALNDAWLREIAARVTVPGSHWGPLQGVDCNAHGCTAGECIAALEASEPTQARMCNRHGGEWGTDMTCGQCTDVAGNPRP